VIGRLLHRDIAHAAAGQDEHLHKRRSLDALLPGGGRVGRDHLIAAARETSPGRTTTTGPGTAGLRDGPASAPGSRAGDRGGAGALTMGAGAGPIATTRFSSVARRLFLPGLDGLRLDQGTLVLP
jgi:hypothetical protein